MRTIKVLAKCSDTCRVTVSDNGTEIVNYDGYTPEFLRQGGIGEDYLEVTIDAATGQILNWKPPTDEEIEEMKWFSATDGGLGGQAGLLEE